MRPPSSRVATPCRTAFSTSGCRISGGTSTAAPPGVTDARTVSRLPNRTCSTRRYCSASATSRAERNSRLAAERQAVAKEIAEQRAHQARLVAVGRNEPGNRVEAVEEKVRIHLRAKRAKLGVALRHLRAAARAAPPRRAFERLRACSAPSPPADTRARRGPASSVSSTGTAPGRARPPGAPAPPTRGGRVRPRGPRSPPPQPAP